MMKILFFKEGKKMISKKKKVFVLVSMVILLVVTGFLNVYFNKTDSDLETTTTSANFFTTCRADKIASRNYQLEMYDTIINTSSNAEEVSAAKAEKNIKSSKSNQKATSPKIKSKEKKTVDSKKSDVIETDKKDTATVAKKSENKTTKMADTSKGAKTGNAKKTPEKNFC